MGANGWRDVAAPKILESRGDSADAAPRRRRQSRTREGFDGAEWNPAEARGCEEEDKFRGLVEQLDAGVYVVAANGNVAYVNPCFARSLGYEPDEVIGRSMLQFIAESKRAAATKRFVSQMIGRERVSKYSSTLLRRDGSPVDVLVDAAVGTYSGHRATIGVLLDIGDRMRTEERICEEEEKFRSLVEQNVAGIAIVRDDGAIGYCNACFAKMIGYEPEDIVGRLLLDFVPEDERPTIVRSLRSQLVETGAPVQIASTMRARDGGVVSVLVSASKSAFEGRPASIAVVVDVTERNAAQRKLASTAAILAAEHEASPDGILVVEPRGRIISVNRRFGQIFGVPTDMLAAGDDERVLALASRNVAELSRFRAPSAMPL